MPTHTHSTTEIRDMLLAMEQAAVNAIIQGHSMVTVQNWIEQVYIHLVMFGLRDGAWTFGELEPGKCLTTSFNVHEVETALCALLIESVMDSAA